MAAPLFIDESLSENQMAVQASGLTFSVLVAKSILASGSLLHQASELRERGRVRGTALQPVIQATDIHRRRRDDMLKMSARLPDVARTAQAHRAHTLGVNPLDDCSPGILLLELLGLLSLTGGN